MDKQLPLAQEEKHHMVVIPFRFPHNPSCFALYSTFDLEIRIFSGHNHWEIRLFCPTNFELPRKDVYYFKDTGECDFIIGEHGRISEAVQVCWKLEQANRGREFRGLSEAMNRLSMRHGTVLTWDQEETTRIKGRTVRVLPAWKWLLDVK